MKHSGKWTRLACSVAMAVALLPAHAADKEQEQIKRLKLQMRQIQQEQTDSQAKLAAEKAELEKSVSTAKSSISASKAEAAAASRRAASLGAEIKSLKDEKQALTDQVAQLQKQLEELKQGSQLAADQSKQQLAEQKDAYQALLSKQDQCMAHNVELVRLGQDLLTRYEAKGFGEVLGAKEPMIQLGRVKLENLAQSYRDKIDAARAQP
ncbi:MAG: hypothetical protein ACK4F8_02125 [Aquabacterium sp.]